MNGYFARPFSLHLSKAPGQTEVVVYGKEGHRGEVFLALLQLMGFVARS